MVGPTREMLLNPQYDERSDPFSKPLEGSSEAAVFSNYEFTSKDYKGGSSYHFKSKNYSSRELDYEGDKMDVHIPSWMVPVIHRATVEDIRRDFNILRKKGVNIVEIRLDALMPRGTPESRARMGVNIIQIANYSKKHSIISMKRGRDGGTIDDSRVPEKMRLDLLEQAIEQGFLWVELESDIPPEKLEKMAARAREKGSSIILSHQIDSDFDFSGLDESLRDIMDILKVNVKVEKQEDYGRMFDAMYSARGSMKGKAVIIHPWGIYGDVLNVLTPLMNNTLNYALSDGNTGKHANNDQNLPDIEESLRIHNHLGYSGRSSGRFWSVTDRFFHEESKLCLVIGKQVNESMETIIFNSAFKTDKVDAFCIPKMCDYGQLARMISLIRELPSLGMYVTTPLKRSTGRMVNELRGISSKVGSVNTVKIEDGKLIGYNTNGQGIVDIVKSDNVEEGARILLLGSGGTARAAALELRDQGYKTFLTGSNVEQCRQVIRELGGNIGVVSVKSVGKLKGKIDVVINTTMEGVDGSKGGARNEMNVGEIARLLEPSLGIDLVFSPPWTAFLASVESRGGATVPGLEVLIAKAAITFEIWTGKKPDKDEMRRAAKDAAPFIIGL